MVIFLVLGLKNVKLSDKFYILLNLTKKVPQQCTGDTCKISKGHKISNLQSDGFETGHHLFLAHCGLVTPYSDWELGQHWLR